MTHTLGFLCDLRRDPALRGRLLENLTVGDEAQMTIGAFLLTFDFSEQRVTVACADPVYPFRHKCPETTLTLLELRELIGAACGC